jgi:hypothetical protein
MFFAYEWERNQGLGHEQMGKTFEQLRAAVLRTDRAEVLRDVHPKDGAGASEGRWLPYW